MSSRQILKKVCSVKFCVATIVCTIFTFQGVSAQDSKQFQEAQIRTVLSKFKNWRYGNITLYEIPNTSARFGVLQKSLNPPLERDAAIDAFVRDNGELDKAVQRLVNARGSSLSSVRTKLEAAGYDVTEIDAAEPLMNYYFSEKSNQSRQFRKAYLVTTRTKVDENTGNMDYKTIALITTTQNSDEVSENLDQVGVSAIKTYEGQLQEPMLGMSKTILEYLNEAVQQGDVVNRTLEAQGIGTTQFIERGYGNTVPISDDNLAQYMRITEGQPMNYQYPNEVIVSLFDLISYRRYELTDASGEEIIEEEVDPADSAAAADATPAEAITGVVYNKSLPKYGIEVRYGLEEINYPSIWSERVAVNAIWGSSRLGAILPTRGWAGLSKAFGQVRKLTSAGWGLNTSLDFPIKIISKSGVFNFGGGYVFDKASSTDHKTFYDRTNALSDFLVRYDAQAHYSFGVNIDQDHWFRFKLGGTVYGMESWVDKDDSTNMDPNTGEIGKVFAKASTETIGGISGRIEYMAVNKSTPYGIGVQYFDEAIMADAWLQVPITSYFAMRLDAKGFAPIFRDPRAWENKTVFIPTLRAIYNF
ncbi:MAG: hypothetical protein V4642_05815 [Bacteroidota bacterium]